MARFTVGSKLRAITTIALALLGATAMTGMIGSSSSKKSLEYLVKTQDALLKSTFVDMDHDGIRGDVYFALNAEDPKEITEVTSGLAERIQNMKTLYGEIDGICSISAMPATCELRTAYEKAAPLLDNYLAAADRMRQALLKGREEGRKQLSDFEANFNAFVDPMEAVSDAINHEAGEASTAAQATASSTNRWIWAILGLAVVVLIAASHRIGSGILTRLASVRAGLDKMAQKQFNQLIEVGGDDEIADMGRAANTTISAVGRAVTEIAAGARSLSTASTSLQAVASRMEQAASRTHEQAKSVATTSNAVRANCESTAAGGGQMRQSIEEIAHRCVDAANAAQEAVRSASAARQSMEALVGKSNEIGEVVRFISTIAEQTNLLALNATIESARAGESGRGFAVVANEVKSLALETARSTNVVREKVAAIQEETGKVGDLIGQIDSVIQRIDGIQSTIAGAVQEQTATTSEMAESMAAVSSGAQGIKESIDDVTTNAQAANAASGEVAKASGDLSRIAEEMNRLVSEFEVAR